MLLRHHIISWKFGEKSMLITWSLKRNDFFCFCFCCQPLALIYSVNVLFWHLLFPTWVTKKYSFFNIPRFGLLVTCCCEMLYVVRCGCEFCCCCCCCVPLMILNWICCLIWDCGPTAFCWLLTPRPESIINPLLAVTLFVCSGWLEKSVLSLTSSSGRSKKKLSNNWVSV